MILGLSAQLGGRSRSRREKPCMCGDGMSQVNEARIDEYQAWYKMSYLVRSPSSCFLCSCLAFRAIFRMKRRGRPFFCSGPAGAAKAVKARKSR